MTLFELSVSLHLGSFTLELTSRVEARSLTLFGPSGSGKSSVLEVVAGLRTPEAGRVAIGGHVLFDSATGINLPARDRRIGYVPQDVLLFPHLSVRQNVTYGSARGTGPSLDEVVSLLDLGALMPRRPASLSGGERQRVALARALHSGPSVLLLDEPLAALDLGRRRRILDALVDVRDRLRIPFVYVTHAPEEALAVTDQAIVLSDGRMVASGAVAQVLPSSRLRDGGDPSVGR